MSIHTFTDQLRAQGFRMTPQRIAILRVLTEAGGHLTPLEVCERVKAELPGVAEPTIYRTLAFLAEQGLILAAHIGNGQLVYELTQHPHHHLVCRSCGQTRSIDHELLKTLYRQFWEKTGYRIDTTHVTFFGLCPDCQEKPEQ